MGSNHAGGSIRIKPEKLRYEILDIISNTLSNLQRAAETSVNRKMDERRMCFTQGTCWDTEHGTVQPFPILPRGT